MLLRTAFSLIGILFTTNVAAQTELPSTGEMLFQVFGALMFIIFLILGAAWLSKRFNLVNSVRGGDLHVIANLSLGKKEKIVLVNACGRKLLLGVGGHGVNLLQDLSGDENHSVDEQNEIFMNEASNSGYENAVNPQLNPVNNAYVRSETHTQNRLENGPIQSNQNQPENTERLQKPDFSSFLKNIITANNRENKV